MSFLCIISVSFYYILHMRSKMILTFSHVAVFTRNFWKMLEDANVDRDYFEMKMLFSNLSRYLLIFFSTEQEFELKPRSLPAANPRHSHCRRRS